MNTITCHSPQTGSTTVPMTSTIVPVTTAPPRANSKRLRTAQLRTDCSITPSWKRNRTSSLISPAITYHHAEPPLLLLLQSRTITHSLNRQAHAHGKENPSHVYLVRPWKLHQSQRNKHSRIIGSYHISASTRASSHYQVASSAASALGTWERRRR